MKHTRWVQFRNDAFALIYSFALVWLVYGRSLHLPFYFDDLLHMPYVAETPLRALWASPGVFNYYRPLQTTIWRLSYILFEENNPFFLHGINLFFFALSGFLCGILSRDILPYKNEETNSLDWQLVQQYLSATLFLLFPFSFQAVPWISSLSYCLAVFLMLAALVCYVRGGLPGGLPGGQRNQRIWGGLSLLFTFFAPLALEVGVVTPFLILLFTLTKPRSEEKRKFFSQAFLWFAPLLAWFILWRTRPLTSDALTWKNPETFMQNSSYFAQGVGYTLTWAGGWLRDVQGWNDLLTAVILSLFAVTLALIIQYRCYYKDAAPAAKLSTFWFSPSLFPWLWAAMTSLLFIAFLPFIYTISAPRLLLVPSPGIAWIWANVITSAVRYSLARPTHLKWITAVFAGLLTLMLIGQNFFYIWRQMNNHSLLGSAFQQAVTLAEQSHSRGYAAGFINFPNEVRSRQTTYPLGHEGVLFYVDYLDASEILQGQTVRPLDVSFLQFDDIRPERPYDYGVIGDRTSWAEVQQKHPKVDVFVTEFFTDSIKITPAGILNSSPTPDFTDAIVGYTLDEATPPEIMLLDAEAVSDGKTLRINLVWSTRQPPPGEVTVFVHVLDDAGQLVAQADGFPVARTYPMNQWPANTVVQDFRTLDVNSNYAAITIGLYNFITGERLLARQGQQALPDDAFTIRVK